MVQVPVLPLRTPLTEWTHGVYIDEFTEYQSRDMPARQAMGAFIPSQGVGTGFRRDALDAFAHPTAIESSSLSVSRRLRERIATGPSGRQTTLRPTPAVKDGDSRVLSAYGRPQSVSAHVG